MTNPNPAEGGRYVRTSRDEAPRRVEDTPAADETPAQAPASTETRKRK